ncbi:hypothetical protein ACFL0Q_08085, partial [Thermodesulfobacteriota bacterium]
MELENERSARRRRGQPQLFEQMERSFEKWRNSPSWLNRASAFDHGLSLNQTHRDEARELFISLQIPDRTENRVNFEILLANLLHHEDKYPIAISLDRKNWLKSKYRRAGPSTIKLVNVMHAAGLIKMRKGYQTNEESRYTRIWASEKLLANFPELPNCVVYTPVQLVELRDGDGRLKEYKDTATTYRVRAILQRANEINTKADIRYGSDKLNTFLTAIFRENFEMYGRLHTRGSQHYQGFPEADRAEITINGERGMWSLE